MIDVHVNIFPSALDSLKNNAIHHSPNETGGVMAGTRSFQNGSMVFNILGSIGVAEFEEFTGIYESSPTKFICTDRLGWAHLSLKAVRTFGASYIGDWHSHSDSSMGTLSQQDIHHLAKQFTLGQFYPFPPLHVLINMPSSITGYQVTAHIMLGKSIVVLEPQIIGIRQRY